MVRVRFAPSPTGFLHVGNIRIALANWLFAAKNSGTFVLRIDDTDLERSTAEHEQAIYDDLKWLGLQWGELYHQSKRFDLYETARAKLVAAGRIYACYETQEELAIKRKMLLSRGAPPIYDRASLKLTAQQIADYESQGRKPHYRFLLEDKPIEWNDLIKGRLTFEGENLSDPVIIREDGVPLYTFPSVIDDGDMKITHVIRGEDHVSNTAVQTQIYTALGYEIPQFAHLALLKSKDGEISKRLGGFSIRELRNAGIMAMAINSVMSRLGTSLPVEPFTSMSPLIESMDFSSFSKSPSNYSMEDVERVNARILSMMDFASVAGSLESLGISGVESDFWNAVRPNLSTLKDIEPWLDICTRPLKPQATDLDFTRHAATLLPTTSWDNSTWQAWVGSVKEATGRKGKDLFMPLRLALTGMEHGPELANMLPLIGYDRAFKRLNGEAA